MQIPHVANTHQIGRQLAELEQEIHSALKDIRRNLEELEGFDDKTIQRIVRDNTRELTELRPA